MASAKERVDCFLVISYADVRDFGGGDDLTFESSHGDRAEAEKAAKVIEEDTGSTGISVDPPTHVAVVRAPCGALVKGVKLWGYQTTSGGIPEEPRLFTGPEEPRRLIRVFAKELDTKVEPNVGGGEYASDDDEEDARTFGPITVRNGS